MPDEARCPECDGESIYRNGSVGSFGLYGPSLLQGLGQVFAPATFTVLVCADCGLARYYADKEARSNLEKSGSWTRVT